MNITECEIFSVYFFHFKQPFIYKNGIIYQSVLKTSKFCTQRNTFCLQNNLLSTRFCTLSEETAPSTVYHHLSQ